MLNIKKEIINVDTEDSEIVKLGAEDILAIIIAVYKTFIPWVLVLASIYALLLLIFDLIY